MSTPFTLLYPTALDDVDSLGIAKNDAAGTLASPGLAIGGASFTLTDAGDAGEFGASGPVSIDDEIIYVSRSGNLFTVITRGAEGTTEANHSAGASVQLLATAAYHTVISAAVRAIEAKLGTGASTPSSGTVFRGTGAGASGWGAIVNADVSASAAIDATKIADGSISNAEFQYLNGVASAIQTQLDGKQAAFANQNANQIYAGPASGAAAAPAFRAMVAADIPDLSGTYSVAGHNHAGVYAPVAHSHAISDVTGLQAALDGAQPLDSDLTAIAALTTTSFGRSLLTEASAAALKITLSLNNVENTALSTWTGSTNITTLGTVAAGVWQGTVVGSNYGGAGAVSGVLKANGAGVVSASVAGTDHVAPGAVTTSGLTMATARILGRTTASGGAIEEITIGSGLTLSGGELSASGGGGGGITIGTTTITSGANTKVLFNNAGVVGEYTITGTGNVAMSASPTFTGTLTAATISPTAFISTPVSPAALTADQNDYAGATGLINRFSTNHDNRFVSGMTPGTDGQVAIDVNVGSFDFTYQNSSGNSTINYRFATANGADLILRPNEWGLRFYDSTTQRWRVANLSQSRNTTWSGTWTQTSNDANAFVSGPNGTTNPVFRLINSIGSQATGLSIQGNAAGNGVTLTALSSGTNENILLTPKGTGGVQFPNGAAGTPAIFGANSTNSGFYFSTGAIAASHSGSLKWYSDASNLYIYAASYVLNFSRGGNNDVGLMGAAVNVLQLNGGSSTTPGSLSSPARTPSQITGNQNDYAPGVGLFQRWSSDASRNVTGLAAGQAGQIAFVWNVGSADIVLVSESASSAAANRFTNSGGADITLTANRCVFLQYDATSSRWRAVLL